MATWQKVLTTADDSAYKNSNVSGFLKDNANDTTTGVITAAGFTTTGTWTFDDASSGTVGITAVHTGSGFADNDTSLMTAAAIKQYVSGEVNAGDITSVSFQVFDSVANTTVTVSDTDGVADFTLTNSGGITLGGANGTDTITIGVSNQLDDIHGMTEAETTALASISETTFDNLHGRGSDEVNSIGGLNDSDDGLLVNHSSSATAGDIKVTSFSSVKNAMDDLYWNFAHSSGIKVSGGDVDFDNNLNVDGNIVVGGNLTISGTTTTVSTANLEIEDKNILLGKTDSAFANDAAAVSANTGAGISVVTDSTTANNYANLTWNTSKYLTGWCLEDTANNGVFEAAVMEFSTNSTAPSGNAAGIGSFHYDTGNDTLYIRTA